MSDSVEKDADMSFKLPHPRSERLFQTLVAALVAFGFSLPLVAEAQDVPELQLQQFRPAPGPTDYLNVYSTHPAPHLEYDFGFYLDYASDPLKVSAFSEEFNSVVDSQMTLSLMGNIGLFDFLEVGILLPVTIFQTSGELEPVLPDTADPDGEIPGFGVNDVRLSAKAEILNLLENPLGLAFILTGYIPTGMDDRFVGDDSFGLEALGSIETWIIRGIRVALNLGYRYRHEAVELRENTIGDAVLWGVAANIPLFISTIDLIAELDGSIGIAEKQAGREGIQGGETPAELKLAVRYELHEDWSLTSGIGFAMNDEAVGTPDFRAFIGLGGYWVSGGKWGFDYDGDGIYGVYDKCPEGPEDFDGFEDGDGCPDYDNDGDGVPDELDKCDNTPEGVEIGPDGCPDNDLDGDGIPNDIDKCPEDAEDRDRFEDADGCPDPDNDGDGIPDTADNCPNEAETFNDFLDDDGCPDDPNDKVHISRDRIIITEQVYFDTGKTSIKKQSYDILDAVVEVLNANQQITKIRVEGHTDSRGSDEMNLELSQGRSEAVMEYMVKNGVAEGRVEAIGYGETKPIRTNDTAEGRSYNRRVEFTILEMREY